MILATAVMISSPSEPVQAPPAAVETAPSIRAVRSPGPLRLDGRLDEESWQRAPALDRFWQVYPGDRGSPQENTSARFVYDDHFLYVGIRADLRSPHSLRAPFVRRDLVNSSQDYVQVYLDPLGSRRSSYLFRVNARGSRADAVQDELKGAENNDPDFDWEVRTSIDPTGWSAELRIPLSTLRVPNPGAQDWTVIVYRGVPRAQNVQMASAPLPRVSKCFLCYAGTLHFDELRPGRENLLATPSLVSTVRKDTGAFGHGSTVRVDPSLDLKWLPYPGGSVDLTVNPDFSQTEADSAQLTANARFAVNFPEKRAFFREGSDLVALPIPLLYTRTIISPGAGLRFTHRSDVANGTVFVADDDGDGEIVEPGFLSSGTAAPAAHATVRLARGRISLGSFDLGAVAATKRLAGGANNSFGAVDTNWTHGSDRIGAQIVHSATREPKLPSLLPQWDGRHLTGNAAIATWDHTTDQIVWSARYARYDQGFRTWLGYVPRVGYQEAYLKLLRPHYPEHGVLNELSPYLSYDGLSGIGTAGSERDLAAGVQIAAPRNTSLDISVHPDTTVLNELGQRRRTRFVQWAGSINPAPWVPRLSFSGTRGTAVDFKTGDRVSGQTYGIGLQLRPLDRLSIGVDRSATRLGSGPSGDARLAETVTAFSAAYFISTRLYVVGGHQRFETRRRYPLAPKEGGSLSNLQVTWEASRDLTAYAGVRSGADQGELVAGRGRSTEIYLKVSRTLRSHL